MNKIEGASGDKFGNAEGSQLDLAKDGSFRGYTVILVVQYENDCEYKPFKKFLLCFYQISSDILRNSKRFHLNGRQ